MLLAPRARRAAVVDIGSNTANLAVFSLRDDGGLTRIAEHDEPLRLLRALEPDGVLPARAVGDLLHVLHEFLGEAAVFEADTVDVVATSALREASNRDEVVARIEAELGLRLHVLDASEEGRCAARAALEALPLEDAVVADLGGGSLHLVRVVGREVVDVASLPLGALRLAMRHPLPDPSDHEVVAALRREVSAGLRRVSWLPGADRLIGVGGTLRALARVDRRARSWALPHGHGYRLTADAIESIWELVSRLPATAREDVAGLPAHRADLVVPGALVASWLLRVSGAPALHLCDDGVREGWLLGDTPARPLAALRGAGLLARFPCTVVEAVRADEGRAAGVALFDALARPSAWRETFAAAAWLSGLWSVRPPGPGLLSALFAEPIAGFWQEEILAVADLLSPVGLGQLDPRLRDGFRVLIDVAAARPEGPLTVATDSVRTSLRGTLHVDVSWRFEAAFGKTLNVERREAARRTAG